MPLANAVCHHCDEEILLDDQRSLGFCLNCGTRVTVRQAVRRYEEAQDQGIESEERDAVLINRHEVPGRRNFDLARSSTS